LTNKAKSNFQLVKQNMIKASILASSLSETI
jgi:hypothetical protein